MCTYLLIYVYVNIAMHTLWHVCVNENAHMYDFILHLIYAFT